MFHPAEFDPVMPPMGVHAASSTLALAYLSSPTLVGDHCAVHSRELVRSETSESLAWASGAPSLDGLGNSASRCHENSAVHEAVDGAQPRVGPLGCCYQRDRSQVLTFLGHGTWRSIEYEHGEMFERVYWRAT